MWYKMKVPTETTDDDGIEATAWRWLRDLYLRLVVRGDVHPGRMTEPERNLALDGHHEAMERDLAIVMELVRRGQHDAASTWRENIHRAEGLDHEMADEALDFALSPPTE